MDKKIKWNALRKELRDKIRPGPPPSPAATDGGTPAPYNVVPLAVDVGFKPAVGIIPCRVDSCGCPNRATHWLLDEDGTIRMPACQTHVELAKAKGIVALTFAEARQVTFPYLGRSAPKLEPAAQPRKPARKRAPKPVKKARKRVS